MSEKQEEPTGGQSHDEVEKASEKLVQFPPTRIKQLMKLDPDLQLTNAEAVFLVAKATELFVESLAREVYYSHTAKQNKKTVSKQDFDSTVDAADCLAFLEGALDD